MISGQGLKALTIDRADEEPLAIDDGNARLVIHAATFMTETMYEFGLTVANRVLELVDGGAGGYARGCTGQGSVTVGLSDNDATGDLSAGDVVSIQYLGDCYDPDANGELTGTLDVTLHDVIFGTSRGIFLDASVDIAPGLRLETRDYAFPVSTQQEISGNFELDTLRKLATRRDQRERAEIQSLNTADSSLNPPISLQPLTPVANPVYASALSVAPTTSDVLVAAVQGRYELIGINGGIELPNTLDIGAGANRNFVFRDENTLVGALGLYPETHALSTIAFDPVTGPQVTRTVPEFFVT